MDLDPLTFFASKTLRDGWVGLDLGKQIADDFSLTFHHVPQNALLLLRNLTRGTDERIFLYKAAKQLWY